MPRLDNSDHTVISVFNLDFEENDPGASPPVDLCSHCHCAWLDAELEIDHPPYGDDTYRCLDCGRRLTDDDN